MKRLHWDGQYGTGDGFAYTVTGSAKAGYSVWIQEDGDDEGSLLARLRTLAEAQSFADADYRATMYGPAQGAS